MTPAGVLLIDASPAAPQLSQTLREAGYLVFEVGDGQAALHLLERERPALVLFDFNLSDMDPIDFLTRTRAQAEGAALSILALVSPLEMVEPARLLQADVTDYLVRPVDSARLLATVRTYLPFGLGTQTSGDGPD